MVGSNGEMEGSDGWERIPYFYATASDIQAKPTRVSGGLDLLVITGETIVSPSDYILLVVFFLFRSRSRSSPRPIPTSDIPNCSDLLWLENGAL